MKVLIFPASLAARDGHVTLSHPQKKRRRHLQSGHPLKRQCHGPSHFSSPRLLKPGGPNSPITPPHEQQQRPAGLQRGLGVQSASSESRMASSPLTSCATRSKPSAIAVSVC